MRCLFNLLYGSVPAEFESPFGTVRHVLPRSANVKRPPRLGGLFYRKQPRYERRHARTGALATTGVPGLVATCRNGIASLDGTAAAGYGVDNFTT